MEKRFANETELNMENLQMTKLQMANLETEALDENFEEYLALLQEEEQEQWNTEEDVYAQNITEDTDYVGNSMELYLKDLDHVKRLTEEEEVALGKIIAEGGEKAKEAVNRLVEGNLRLAIFFAKKYKIDSISLEDINMMACEGLIRAAQKFDYTRGVRFSTYAAWWITQSIRRGITNEAGTIRKPVHMNGIINKVRKAQKELEQKLSREATAEEIALFTGLAQEQVKTALKAMVRVVSFDAKVTNDGDTTLLEMVADNNSPDICDTVIEEGLRTALLNALSILSEKEATVLKLRNGIGGGRQMTLEEIGKLPQFGVSRERVRQIEIKAIRKLRHSAAVRNALMDFAC